jgi:hypothetical protein
MKKGWGLSSKIKPKFKKRRSITGEELFPKKAALELLRMKFSIERAIPDLEERQKYIEALIKKLEEPE